MRLLPLAFVLCAACRVDPEDTASLPHAADASALGTALTTTLEEGPAWIDPIESEVHLLDGGPEPGTLFPPSLSPDGARVAMCQLDPDAGEGSKRNTITEGRVAFGTAVLATARQYCGDVRYSPDGTMVAWNEQDLEGVGHLRVTPVDGDTALAGDDQVRATLVFSPAFVREGAAVAALTGQNTDAGPIMLADIATGERTTLQSAQAESWIVASPDGRLLATRNGYGLVVVDTNLDSARVVWTGNDSPEDCLASSPDLALDCFVEPHAPSFSPDGTQIVFLARPTEGGETWPDLRVLNLLSGEVRLLADREHFNEEPVFGADGQTVYWLRDFESVVRADSTQGPDAAPEVVYRGWVDGLRSVWPSLAR
jgi:Tol biopolymer transport system component